MRLGGKVAIVTGAGQGIGQAIALAFSRKETKVVVADVNPVGISETAAKIKSIGGECLGIKTDVSIVSEVKAMMDRTVACYKTLDILVNNAGIVRPGHIENLSEEDWDKVINVNLRGTFLCSKYAAQVMIPNRQGRIINIASIAGHEPNPDGGAYSVTKAGIIALTTQCAIAWGRHNIRVNSISPGLIWTSINPFYEDPKVRQARQEMVPLGRLGSPDDIASVAVLLASDETGYISGCDIRVDGGFLKTLIQLLPGRPTDQENPPKG
jgi:3-oxoacyl-[acyl-carrier protein] reductase